MPFQDRQTWDGMKKDQPPLAILCAGGLSRSVIRLAQALEWPILGLFDDDPAKKCTSVSGVPVLGKIDTETLRSYRVTWAVCATGHQAIKLKIVKSLASLDLEWVTMVHPRAIVDPSSIIGKGALLGPGVIVQHNCSIGEFSFIGDNVCLGMFATVSPYVTCQMGANLVDESQVGFGAWISAGAVVLPRVRVGSWCFVGPNASVEQDVAANCRAVGVPAVVTEGQGTKPADFSDCSEESTPVAANVMLLSASSPSRDNQSWSVFRRDASPRKINWCPYKPLDIDRFHQYLLQSLNSRHVTNFGPGQKLLGDRFRSYLGNPDTHEVITAANGTAALHALVAGIGIARGMPLRTVTQAVTFAPAIQGPLKGSLVVDYDQALKGPCLDELGQHKDEFDAVLLTNCFGNVANMDVYVEWCRREQKVLVIDNAATPLTQWNGKNSALYADGGAIVSLHETKPIGRGEGGLIVVAKQYATAVRQAMNFGFSPAAPGVPHPEGSNWRMSDIGAAAVMCHWDSLDYLIEKHLELRAVAQVRVDRSKALEWAFPLDEGQVPGVLSAICIQTPRDSSGIIRGMIAKGIEAKQYYIPVVARPQCPKAWVFFDRIVCMPIHRDLTPSDIEFMFDALEELCESAASAAEA